MTTESIGPGEPPDHDGLPDYTVVAYRRGTTATARRTDGGWITEYLDPGDVSLLTRAARSHWVWPDDVEVVHVPLTRAELTATCRAMYEREVEGVRLLDEVKAVDPAVHRTALLIATEAAHGGAGSRLLVDSLTCELCVHILRKHAHVHFREASTGRLSPRQERAVRDYVRQHLEGTISLDDLAGTVSLSRYHFARRFKRTTGMTPHELVVLERVARAQDLLRHSADPLLDIAHCCGFFDQSHMTRVFRTRLGVTPGRYRARA